MDAIIRNAIVGEDRRVVIDLPPDTPIGPVQLTIQVDAPQPKKELTREEAKQRLRAAGLLREDFWTGKIVERISDDELDRIGRLPPGAQSSEEMIAEGRGRE